MPSTQEWAAPRLAAKSGDVARPGYSDTSASEYLDKKDVLKAKVKAVAALIRNSSRVVVYTGVGISTASGIGDYASKATNSVAPHLAKGKVRGGGGSRLVARPTLAHHALAALQQKGRIQHWLQQNHDRLAQKAGFPQAKINEVHGAWGDDYNPVVLMDGELRPDMAAWMEAWATEADLVIAVGTTLCGMYADCVAQAAASGRNKNLVIVNLQPTPLDDGASVRAWALCDDFFAMLAKELGVKSLPDKRCADRGEEWDRSHPGCKYRTPKRTAASAM